jgi:hypothetical protein
MNAHLENNRFLQNRFKMRENKIMGLGKVTMSITLAINSTSYNNFFVNYAKNSNQNSNT